MVWEAAAEGDEWVRCLGRKYAWEEVKVFRGGVVEFEVEFGPKIGVAMGFDAGSCTRFGDRSEEVCDASVGWCRGCACNMGNRWEEMLETL